MTMESRALTSAETKAFSLTFVPFCLAVHRNSHLPEADEGRRATARFLSVVCRDPGAENLEFVTRYEVLTTTNGEEPRWSEPPFLRPDPPPTAQGPFERWHYPPPFTSPQTRFVVSNAQVVAWELLERAVRDEPPTLERLAECVRRYATEWGVDVGNVEEHSWWFESPTPETVRLTANVLDCIVNLATATKAVQLRQMVPAPRGPTKAALRATDARIELAERVEVEVAGQSDAALVPFLWCAPRVGEQPTLGFWHEGDGTLDGRFPITRIATERALRTYMRMIWASRRSGGLFRRENLWAYESTEVLRAIGVKNPSGSAIEDDRKGVRELLGIYVDKAKTGRGRIITAEKPEPLITRYLDGRATLYAHSRLAEETWRRGDCAQVYVGSLRRSPQDLAVAVGVALFLRTNIIKAEKALHNEIRTTLDELLVEVGRSEAVRGHKGSKRDEWDRIRRVALEDLYVADARLDEATGEVIFEPHMLQFHALEPVWQGAKAKAGEAARASATKRAKAKTR